MIGIGGFLFILGLIATFTGVFSAAGPILIIVGLILAALGLFGGENTGDFGAGMKDGCGCVVGIIVIAVIGLFFFKDGGCTSSNKSSKHSGGYDRSSNKSSKREVVRADDKPLYVVCDGAGYIDGKMQSASMVVRWKDGRYELYVNFGKNIFLRGIKECVCGPSSANWEIRNPNSVQWSASTDGESVFYGGNVPALLNEIRREEKFSVIVVLKDGRKCGAAFMNFKHKIQDLINKVE